MTRFNVNGTYLDLYADTKLQFVRKNMLFAFGEMEINRTTGFDVPATPNNNAIFELANIPAKDGTKARGRIAAELQYSGGKQDGYLYISVCQRNRYSVIYVYGELLSLKAIKEAGRIADLMVRNTLSVDWGNTGVATDASPYYARLAANRYAMLLYKPLNVNVERYWTLTAATYGLRPLPSVSLSYLVDECAAAVDVTINRNDSSNVYSLYRLVQPELRGANGALKYEDAWGAPIYLRYNVPDLNILDLLKTEAILQGRSVYYKDGVVEYVTVDLSAWEIQDIGNIIELTDIERKVGEHAQNNIVKFDSNSYIKDGERISQNYTIDNKLLTEEASLYTIPISEGGRQSVTYDDMTKIAGVVDDIEGDGVGEAWEIVGGKHTLLYCGMGNFATGKNYMTPPPMERLSWFDNVCRNSTQIKATVPMPLYMFQTLEEKKLLNLHGSLYVWTEAEWQDGVARLSLSKIII